jgi:hypothetical protein
MKNLGLGGLVVGTVLSLPLLCFSQNTEQNIDREFTRHTSSHSPFFEWVQQFSSMGHSYAVVIGVSDYRKDFSHLEGAYPDAVRVKDFLLNEAEFDKVYLLTNYAATPDRIRQLMDEVIPKLVVGRNDRFVFYFSGHGTQRPVGDKILGYLVLSDAGQTEYSKMISMDSVGEWDRILEPINQVLFVLDSCFSGAAGIQIKSSPEEMQLKRLSKYAHHLITAGTANQTSVASVKLWGGSLFTSAFIAGASGRADAENSDFGKDGIISLKELMDYVGRRIDAEASTNKAIKMSPEVFALQASSEGEFFFLDRDKRDFVPDAALVAQKYGAPIGSHGELPDYKKVPEDLQEVFLAVKNMVEMSNADNPPVFFVGLWKYYIEGEEYLASGLTVSPSHIRNLRQTQTGFEGEAYFPGDFLTRKAIAGKKPNPAGVYEVHMRVDLHDIFTIVGKKRAGEGQQINLLEPR